MNRVILFVICSVLILNSCLLTGCNDKKAYVLKNEEIDADTRAEIDKIGDSICIALAKKNITYLYTVSGQYMKSQLPKLDSMLQAANVRCKARPVYDQYLVSNSDAIPGYNNLLHSQHNTYDYYFYPSTGLTYLYVTPVKSTNNDLDWLMVCSFAKSDDKWKLTSIYLGPYKYKRKTTFDYYRDYKAYFHKHEYMNAYLSLQLSVNLLRPGQYCTPAIEQGVLKGGKDIDSVIEAGLFPLQRDKNAKLKLLGFRTTFLNGDIYPAVMYKTNTSLSDTISVKNEWQTVSSYLRLDSTISPLINDSMVYVACYAENKNGEQKIKTFTYVAPIK